MCMTRNLMIGMAVCGLLAFQPLSALSQRGSSSAVDQLLENLKDKDWQIRWYAASSLGEMREGRAVEPLIVVLQKDPNGYVRAMAAWALGQIGDPRAVGPLIEALTDESHDVRKRAPLALKQITGEDLGKDQAKWRAWWESKRK